MIASTSKPCASDHVDPAGITRLNLKYLADLWNGIVPVLCIVAALVVVAESATLLRKLTVPVAALVSTIGLTCVTNDLLWPNISVSPVPIVAANADPSNDPSLWFVLNTQTPTEEEFLTADINQDGILNILDVISVVGEILGTTFRESVEWLEENFPQLKTKERLKALDKSIYFAK